MVLAAGLLTSSAFASTVPMPRARPADAPRQMAQPKPADKTLSEITALPSQPSACRLALTDAIAIAPTLPPISGPGECGGDDLVRLEAVVMPDRSRVPLKPAATLRCTMATAVAEWVRGDVAAIATGLGTRVAELDNYDSYNCRGRNRVAGAKMSEHGKANALDLRGIRLANGKSIALTERETPREQREKVLESVCGRFTTVLGPGSDGYHEDHIHLDLAERRGGYRICQWAVLEPMPAFSLLMPVARPADAPPREPHAIAARQPEEDAAKPQAGAVSPSRLPAAKPAEQPRADQTARPDAEPPQARRSAHAPSVTRADAPKSQRKRRARREPSLFESIFRPEPVTRRKKSAGPADAFR